MVVKKGNGKTSNGTAVVIEESYIHSVSRAKLWIGHVMAMGEGNPQGVMVWDENGNVANYGVSEAFRKDMGLI